MSIDNTTSYVNGIFIVLEGADGSGKTTQFKLLAERLKAAGYSVELFDFPNYDKPSSHFIKQYLNGHYGPASNISPYTASIFYSLDRYEAAPAIRGALSGGKIVLSNRYVGSNMAHQGSKITDPAEQRGFFIWNESLEYNLLGIPRPSVNIFLRVPADVSFNLIGRKKSRKYTNKSHDEHEGDINHLTGAVSAYDTLSRLFPRDFITVDCVKNNRLLSIPEVSNLIWENIKSILPSPPPNKGRELILDLDSFEYIEKKAKPGRKKAGKEIISPRKSTKKSSGVEPSNQTNKKKKK